MNYFDRINKQLIVLALLSSGLLLIIAYTLRDGIIRDLMINLCAGLITAAVALAFVGYVRHKNTSDKTKPAYRLAKSNIHTTIYGTVLDLGEIYGHPIDPNEFFKMRSYKEHEDKTDELVKKLKAIKNVKTDLDFGQLPKRLQAEARNNIYEIDQIMRLYSFALPLEVKIKLLEVRADYKELEFVLAINPINTKLSSSAKTIIAISIFKLKMSVVSLYLMMESMHIDDTIHLVDE